MCKYGICMMLNNSYNSVQAYNNLRKIAMFRGAIDKIYGITSIWSKFSLTPYLLPIAEKLIGYYINPVHAVTLFLIKWYLYEYQSLYKTKLCQISTRRYTWSRCLRGASLKRYPTETLVIEGISPHFSLCSVNSCLVSSSCLR